MELDRKTGCLSRLDIRQGKELNWTSLVGDVTVRDDRLRKTFDRRDLRRVVGGVKGKQLMLIKEFKGAPWRLEETYAIEKGCVCWTARLVLESGDFRSCAIGYHIPWPQPLYPISFWAARDNMPSAPHRFAQIALEYGEITSGILIPALVAYQEDKNFGLLLAMPFDFKAPRLRFISEYRGPDLQAEFDWLALAPGKTAKASLILKGTEGAWRPALGWLYERYKEYFEPRSKLIHSLWGGHVCGGCNVSREQARLMAQLGLRWHEVHFHFPAYGNYHPEGMSQWPTGAYPEKFEYMITVDMIRRTIRNLHQAGSAAMPYIQVTGDGAARLLVQTSLDPAFNGSRVRDLQGNLIYADGCDIHQYNSDLSLPFGKDIARQIEGMVKRYPGMDGVFLDQACYNWTDAAHHDGITAINNQPCYMTGFNYDPHLEHLSRLLHPKKAIIGNGPHCIRIMKYIDGFMAEGSGWLCDVMQYYSLAKPMFFLLYHTTDRDIELMFQRCLIYAAGFTSYPGALPSKDLYARYVPLLRRLFGRRWVFDANPLTLPTGFKGNVYRGINGNLLASMVSEEPRLAGRKLHEHGVYVRTKDSDAVRQVTLQQPGGRVKRIAFKHENGAVQFDIPGDLIAGVAELHVDGKGQLSKRLK